MALRFILLLGILTLAGCQPLPEQPEITVTPSPTQAAYPVLSATPIPTTTPTNTPTISIIKKPSLTLAPTPTATLPPAAMVKGMYGYGQLQELSCEARSAADWARHFGIEIHEMEFMARLTKSNNPEKGFVGSPRGGWGQLPPDGYGVHAAPVAEVLRQYGAQARATRDLPLNDLLAELAAGRPVMVWVTGHVEKGKSTPYRVDGEMVTVARYEHTVIAIGYDAKTMHILDGKTVYKRSIDTFQQSWAVLGNMAIIWREKTDLGRR